MSTFAREKEKEKKKKRLNCSSLSSKKQKI